jgi:hypothetical protein
LDGRDYFATGVSPTSGSWIYRTWTAGKLVQILKSLSYEVMYGADALDQNPALISRLLRTITVYIRRTDEPAYGACGISNTAYQFRDTVWFFR